MKKIVSLLLALTLVLGMTALTASAETVDMSEPMDIELMAYYVMDVPEDDPIMTYLEEKFNVNFKLTITNVDNYTETLNMRVASDQVADWFRIQDLNLYQQMAQDGMLMNVSELVEKYHFENIQNTLNLPNANGLKVNDAFYCVPDTIGKLTPGVYYRKDWLKELGLKEPTNFEEFRTVLEKVVESDPDGMGTSGFTMYDFDQVELFMFPSWSGYCGWGELPDGKLQWMYEDEAYKDFIKYFAGLYNDKLLDSEMFVNNYEICMEKLATGRAGFYIMNLNTTWWSNNKMGLAAYDPEAELGAILPCLEGPAGKFLGSCAGNFYASSSFSSDISEEKAARILAIMDFLLSDEGRDMTLYGIEEGKYYDLVDGKKIQKSDVVNKEWGQSLHFVGEIADFGTNDRLAVDEDLIRWNEYLDDTELVRSRKTDLFMNDEAAVIMTELKEIITNYRTAWLTGEKDIDATWDEFQKKIKEVGVETYRELLAEYLADYDIHLDKVL